MFRTSRLIALLPLLSGVASASAQSIAAPYSAHYSLTDLGAPTDVPRAFGGLTLQAGQKNILLLAGTANASNGALYAVPLLRDVNNHIIGFAGPATRYCDAAFIDGGLAYGPGGVLFLSRWPENKLGQTKPGSAVTDKIVELASWGVESSISSVNFVPAGFPGAGRCKIATYPAGQWWDVTLSPDGQGTYNVIAASRGLDGLNLTGKPEGFTFIPGGSPVFPFGSIVVSEFQAGAVSSYVLDVNGNPKLDTRTPFITGLSSAEGAFIDPYSGDLLFSSFGGGKIIAVRGFTAQPPCDANCDGSTSAPVLNANDFQCFLNLFAGGNAAANCDGSTVAPVLNANDFQCYLNKFAAGCGV